MKKILCFMMFVLLLVSCSKDSSEEVGLPSNYIEVAGVRHQIDKFVIENETDFRIGSKKDGDNYIVDIYIGSSKYKTIVHYEGKMI